MRLNCGVRHMGMNCAVCHAPLNDNQETCLFDVPEAIAPWRGDYEAMARGQMSHAEHLVIVARWVLHNRASQSIKVIEKYSAVAEQSAGVSVASPPAP